MYESHPPLRTLSLSIRRPKVTSFTTSNQLGGTLTPELQPNSPSVFPIVEKEAVCQKIGNYLLLDHIEVSATSSYKAVHVITQQRYTCKVIQFKELDGNRNLVQSSFM